MGAFRCFTSLAIKRGGGEDSLLYRKTDLGPFHQERGVFYRKQLFSVTIAAPQFSGPPGNIGKAHLLHQERLQHRGHCSDDLWVPFPLAEDRCPAHTEGMPSKPGPVQENLCRQQSGWMPGCPLDPGRPRSALS